MCPKTQIQNLELRMKLLISHNLCATLLTSQLKVYLIEDTATDHIQWALTRLMEVECDLSVDADAKVVVHVKLTMRQPVHMQSSSCMALNIDQPTIQLD